MTGNRNNSLQAHFSELQKKYPGLKLLVDERGLQTIKGKLKFSATYENVTIDDEYDIEIELPDDYPEYPPKAKEIGERITKEFHVNPDGTLCLGAPLKVRMKYNDKPDLLGFVENVLIDFLYSFSYKEKFGKLPFGELPHGGEGIVEYYCDLFKVKDRMFVLNILLILCENKYRGHHNCPCGSGRKIRECHGEQIFELMKHQKPDDFLDDYFQVLSAMKSMQGIEIPNSLLSEKLLKRFRRKYRNQI